MIKCTSIGTLATLIAVVALAAQPGCSKDEKKDAAKKPIPTKTANTTDKTAATPVKAGTPAAATKLLALKFHHDD